MNNLGVFDSVAFAGACLGRFDQIQRGAIAGVADRVDGNLKTPIDNPLRELGVKSVTGTADSPVAMLIAVVTKQSCAARTQSAVKIGLYRTGNQHAVVVLVWAAFEPGLDQPGFAEREHGVEAQIKFCLLYTSPSPRDLSTSRMPSSA